MSALAKFATANHPIRVSSLPSLIRCPAQMSLIHLDVIERTSGKAADTGSAAHFAIAAYHKGAGVDDSLKAMIEATPEFPLADFKEATKFVHHYTKDPRNRQDICVEAEFRVEFQIPCHPTDPTGEPIHLTGTCDQVRYADSGYEVWDYKTGGDTGFEMLSHFVPQLAGYTTGVSFKYPNVRVGGIIRGMGYRSRGVDKGEPSPDGVFFKANMSLDDCAIILNRVRAIVAGIRRGEALYGPGVACEWCPYGSIGTCIPVGKAQGLTF